MKKSSKILVMLSLAFVMLLAVRTSSKAAGWDAGLKQKEAEKNSVTIEWQTYMSVPPVNHYEITYSLDGKEFFPVSSTNYTSDTSFTIRNLTADSTYWVCVTAYDDSFYSETKKAIATSEPIQVATLGNVAKVENLVQTVAANNSATISWSAVAGASSYDVYLANGLWNYTKVGNTTQTSFTIGNLPVGYAGEYFVMAKKTTVNGFEAIADMEWAGYFERIKVKTLPTKVQSIAVSYLWSSGNRCDFQWSAVNNADGYQLQTKNYKGKVVCTSNHTATSGSVSPFKKGQFYATHVRAFVKVGNGYAYGPWSGYSYNASNKNLKWIRSANRKKITLKWKKISGVSGYRVYISTKSDSGYKKVKSFGKKSTGCTITKCGKNKLSKSKTYYVKIEYLKKVGKKNVKSGIVGKGTVY